MKSFVFGIILTTTCFFGCSALVRQVVKEPQVQLDHIDMTNTNFAGTTLMFNVKVQNPNSFDIKVDEVAYKVFLNKKNISSTSVTKPVTVVGNGSTMVVLPLPVLFSQIFSGLGDILSGKGVDYRIEGNAKVAGFNVPFEKDGKIELH